MSQVTETLKAKVLIGYGFLVAMIAAFYAPGLLKAVMPIALCVVLAAVLLNAPHVWAVCKQLVHKRQRVHATSATVQVGTKFTWCTHVDYDNYFMPTYLRDGENGHE